MARLLPDVYENLLDNQLGILPPGIDNVFVKIGTSTTGPVGQVVSVADPDSLKLFGSGPLVESAAYHLSVSGSPLLLVRLPNTVAGTVGAVTATKTGVGNVAVAGQPADAYSVSVTVTRDGGPGTGAFTYSLDGGDNESREMAMPSGGNYTLADTGLTLTFSGALKAGDLFRFSTVAPAATLADVVDAFDVVFADPREWAIVHVLGQASPALAAAVEVKMTEAKERLHLPARAVLEGRDYNPTLDVVDNPEQYKTPVALALAQHAAWQANLLAQFSNVAFKRVGIPAGFTELVSPYNGLVLRRSLAWAYVARLAAIPVHEHPGRVASGPLVGVTELTHDEAATPGLDASGFTTARTFRGRKGFFITRGRNFLLGSDYGPIEYARVIDKACRLGRFEALNYVNDDVRVSLATGKIDPVDAAQIEAHLTAVLRASLLAEGNCSDVFVTLNRDNNIISNRTQPMRVSILPLGYMEYINMDFGFFNPALQVTQG